MHFSGTKFPIAEVPLSQMVMPRNSSRNQSSSGWLRGKIGQGFRDLPASHLGRCFSRFGFHRGTSSRDHRILAPVDASNRSLARRSTMSRRLQITFALFTCALLSASTADAQSIAPGTTQTVPVISVSLNVGNMEKETRRVVYSPPPGWHIRSHRIECTTKTGLASYTVNTVPADWAWSFDDTGTEAAKANVSAAAQAHGFGCQ